MTRRIIRELPLNRVEGDLEIRIELEGRRIVDAWSSGTLYRGFENLMIGRGPLDGLVITPRICGICSTTHLMAAARALDRIAGVPPPANAVRVRNLALMVETCQSDLRQSILMFMPDFAIPAYAPHPLHAEAAARYVPVQGGRCIEAVRETRSLLEIIAILGGQWPHSSFMVPGGVTYVPNLAELNQCLGILRRFRSWYERTVLGCTLERWQAIRSVDELDAWLAERAEHRDGDVGFLLRFAGAAGLAGQGRGHGHFLSCGSLDVPAGSAVQGVDGMLVAAGFLAADGERRTFDQSQIAEHVAPPPGTPTAAPPGTRSTARPGPRPPAPTAGNTRGPRRRAMPACRPRPARWPNAWSPATRCSPTACACTASIWSAASSPG